MADADPQPPREGQSPPVTAQPRKPISRDRMALLFVVMLTTAAGNTAMQSVMPSIGTALQVNDVWISLAYTWSALLWMLCAPIWARRSDKRGRKAMMALGMVGFITSMALCGIVMWFGLAGLIPAFWTLILFAVARSLYGGFGSAAPPAVQAYVAARTARSERTQALSLVASSFGLGTVIGPALAPLMVLPGLGLIGPFAAFTLFGIVTLIALRVLLPNDEPQFPARGTTYGAPYGASTADSSSDEQVVEIESHDKAGAPDTPRKNMGWWEPRLRPWIMAGILGGHAHAMILGLAGFLVLDRMHLRDTPGEGAGPVGLVLMSGAIATLLAQWGVIPRFKLGPRGAILSGVALAALGVIIFGAATDLHSIALGYAIASLGFGLFRPGFNAGASLAVSRAEQGEASGVVASVTGAAFIFAPALGVLLYNWSEWFGFAVVVGLCLAVFVISWTSLAKDEDTTKERA